jgi:hypothetical protein
MAVERCDECGFDGDDWTDDGARDAIAELPVRWTATVSEVDPVAARRRPIPDMWSILEYADHVREVLFAIRFALDSAVAQPGIDLGGVPEPRFDVTPRDIDSDAALEGIAREAELLRRRLGEISAADWESTAIVDGDELNAHWLARHAVHDATHHLADVARLRAASAAES